MELLESPLVHQRKGEPEEVPHARKVDVLEVLTRLPVEDPSPVTSHRHYGSGVPTRVSSRVSPSGRVDPGLDSFPAGPEENEVCGGLR